MLKFYNITNASSKSSDISLSVKLATNKYGLGSKDNRGQ